MRLTNCLFLIIALHLIGCSSSDSTDLQGLEKHLDSNKIHGAVICTGGLPMDSVRVDVTEVVDGQVDGEILFTTYSDRAGFFLLEDIEPMKSYKLALSYPAKQKTRHKESTNNNITSLDSKSSLDDLQRLAVDINEDGIIDAEDLDLLGQIRSGQRAAEWKFLHSELDHPDVQLIKSNEVIIMNYPGDLTVHEFVGILQGDINGNSCPKEVGVQ